MPRRVIALLTVTVPAPAAPKMASSTLVLLQTGGDAQLLDVMSHKELAAAFVQVFSAAAARPTPRKTRTPASSLTASQTGWISHSLKRRRAMTEPPKEGSGVDVRQPF